MGNGIRALGLVAGTIFSALAALSVSSSASADTLHVFCTSPTPACLDNGDITPTSTNPPTFGFEHKPPGKGAGTFYLEVLIPNDVLNADSLSIAISGTNTFVSSLTPGVFSSIAWVSGQLDTYLGIAASPTNPIGAYLPLTQFYDPSATGYFVYQYNFGAVNFGTNDPTFSTSFVFPVGTVINAFLKETSCKKDVCTDSWTATANSASLLITDGRTPPPLPEPATLSLLGAGLIGMRYLRRKRAA
ncbi:MAG TPA: PEP-CTERM sorting domain-containing protein [Rhizomicrobium sp.]|nr:PEP-CTERM sorting domain-containing protein [Rhizomicrobium sp.]